MQTRCGHGPITAHRDCDPQDHVHDQIARITRTRSDGKWRAVDTASLRVVLGAVQAVVAAHVECALTRRYGVQWVARPDGNGPEIAGISQAQMDGYSSRAISIKDKLPGRVVDRQVRACAVTARAAVHPRTATTPARSSGKPAPAVATPPGTTSTATTKTRA